MGTLALAFQSKRGIGCAADENAIIDMPKSIAQRIFWRVFMHRLAGEVSMPRASAACRIGAVRQR